MRIGSLFSGYGGLDLAALQLFPGSSVAWHCEWEEAPSRILAHHWPDVPNHQDVTTLNWGAVEPVDILTGGYPCQPFSAAGRRQGTADERHLWPYVRHAIRYLRPRFTLLENVAGHRSLGFDRVLGDCAEDGLHVRWTSIRASDVGACHRRERLFILVTDPARNGWDEGRPESTWELGRSDATERGDAHASDASSAGRAGVDDSASRPRACGAGQRESGGSAGRAPGPVALLPTPSVADATGGHATRSGARSSELLLPGVARAFAEGKLLPTPTSRDHKGAANPPGRQRDGRARTSGDDMLPDAISKLLPTPRTSDGTGGPNPLSRAERMDDVETRVIRLGAEWGDYEPAIRRQERLSRPAPSPTALSRNGNPRLDPPFPEWMMFLPAGHVTDPAIGLSRNEQLKVIGNGVCPPQAIAAYRALGVVA